MKSNKRNRHFVTKNIRGTLFFVSMGLFLVALIYIIKKPQVLDTNAMSIFNSVQDMKTTQSENFTFESFYLGPYKTALYYPSGNTKYTPPYPVIVFHHGMMAKYDYYTWFAEAMVNKGYIVVLPNRLFLGVNMDSGVKMTNSLLDYLSVRNRYSDSLRRKVDLNKVGIAGHSMGADLTLYSADLKTKSPINIKALVAIAPASKDTDAMKVVVGTTKDMPLGKYIESTMNKLYDTVSANEKPTMYLVGSSDSISTPQATQTFYDLNKSKKMLAIINGANHMQFSPVEGQGSEIEAKLDKKPTILDEEVFELTKTYVGAWMDYFVKGDKSARSILEQGKSLYPNKFTNYTLAF